MSGGTVQCNILPRQIISRRTVRHRLTLPYTESQYYSCTIQNKVMENEILARLGNGLTYPVSSSQRHLDKSTS